MVEIVFLLYDIVVVVIVLLLHMHALQLVCIIALSSIFVAFNSSSTQTAKDLICLKISNHTCIMYSHT